ncbi:MAG: helix-turn-helix domain-containing protein [Muribaculaceae bacterium]|nr:helix-turn-helix domain-containing protein [Muribaculaceae bacterium]
MNRIDLVRLRKRAGMSQRELAELLQVRPSFLSAIENGKSRLPEEKLAKIKEIFEIDSFDDYILEEDMENINFVPPHTHTDTADSLTHLLTHFHDLAHKNSHNSPDPEYLARLDFLLKRNERLSVRVDDLRDEVDTLRNENIRLKELLMQHGISYK